MFPPANCLEIVSEIRDFQGDCLNFWLFIKKRKGVQSLKKRLTLIQNFKSKIGPCGLLFLQETHSNSKVEQKWKEDFHDKDFFSHEKTNSRSVLIVYFGTEKFTVKK